MKNLQTIIRRLFFVLAAVVALIGVLEKVANLMSYTLWRGLPEQGRLIEITAIALLFGIAMQLHEIRQALTSKTKDLPK